MDRTMVRLTALTVWLLLCSSVVLGAVVKGTVYNEDLEIEKNVLLEVNTTPIQKYLSRNGEYSFSVPPGKYVLTGLKGEVFAQEEVEVIHEGEFLVDLFLLPSLAEEEDLLRDTEQEIFIPGEEPLRLWAYIVAGVIFVVLLLRIIWARKKYGPLRLFRKKTAGSKEEAISAPDPEPAASQESQLEEVLSIIRKQGGRITQKELRRELMHLSEAKVSLLVTELEHKGKIEKVKRGRGNVLMLK